MPPENLKEYSLSVSMFFHPQIWLIIGSSCDHHRWLQSLSRQQDAEFPSIQAERISWCREWGGNQWYNVPTWIWKKRKKESFVSLINWSVWEMSTRISAWMDDCPILQPFSTKEYIYRRKCYNIPQPIPNRSNYDRKWQQSIANLFSFLPSLPTKVLAFRFLYSGNQCRLPSREENFWMPERTVATPQMQPHFPLLGVCSMKLMNLRHCEPFWE